MLMIIQLICNKNLQNAKEDKYPQSTHIADLRKTTKAIESKKPKQPVAPLPKRYGGGLLRALNALAFHLAKR